jgi:hypothetical protein
MRQMSLLLSFLPRPYLTRAKNSQVNQIIHISPELETRSAGAEHISLRHEGIRLAVLPGTRGGWPFEPESRKGIRYQGRPFCCWCCDAGTLEDQPSSELHDTD